jgi:hypothetical protein
MGLIMENQKKITHVEVDDPKCYGCDKFIDNGDSIFIKGKRLCHKCAELEERLEGKEVVDYYMGENSTIIFADEFVRKYISFEIKRHKSQLVVIAEIKRKEKA